MYGSRESTKRVMRLLTERRDVKVARSRFEKILWMVSKGRLSKLPREAVGLLVGVVEAKEKVGDS